tara:strand:+ start:1520 stop:2767 length:1248 start_codon:yes stop_codon:yes gene_type:complete
MTKKYKIAIIGLGYVGLPLALSFSKIYDVIGFDIKEDRIDSLNNGIDNNTGNNIINNNINFTSSESDIASANIFVLTVPTPITVSNEPDLTSLELASAMVAKYISNGDIIIYESTVYPGVTEDICVPILEKVSALKYNSDFFCGYSPERISPGDDNFNIENLIKVTSGSNSAIAQEVDDLYKKIIPAGTYKAESIKIAEAAKITENIQRDVNIALMNELAVIYDKMNISMSKVIKASSTKSNFIKFKPGLVGGHCIGVDPYYLSYHSKNIGLDAELILTSRRINNSMSDYIARKTAILLKKYAKPVKKSEVLILGYTFKENCSDTRNTRVKNIINKLKEMEVNVSVYDPYLLKQKESINLINNPFNSDKKYDAFIAAVSHDKFKNYTEEDFISISNGKLVFLDVKNMYSYSTWKF